MLFVETTVFKTLCFAAFIVGSPTPVTQNLEIRILELSNVGFSKPYNLEPGVLQQVQIYIPFHVRFCSDWNLNIE